MTEEQFDNGYWYAIEVKVFADEIGIPYTSSKETKDFIVKEALKIGADLKRESGAWYRLNRWREEQVDKGIKITYEDLVKHYVKLNQLEGSFPQAPSGRYVNFLSNFLAGEKNATRKQAVNAWGRLKKLDIPKDYQSWKKYRQQTADSE